jgi:hypothetical protein
VERLSLATSQGKVFLALRNNIDASEEVSARGITVPELLGQSANSGSELNPVLQPDTNFGSFLQGLADKNLEAPAATPSATATHTMEIIRGSEVEEKTFSLN